MSKSKQESAVAVDDSPVQTEMETPAPAVPEVQAPLDPQSQFYMQLLASFQRVMAEQAQAQTERFLEIIKEIRKPIHDPIKEAQQSRAKQTQRQGQEAYWKQLEQRAENCTHMREDMTSAIAWAQQSDTYADHPALCESLKISGAAATANLIRGHCQHCQTKFSPIREECVSEKVWQRYGDMRRIPTQRGSGVLYVNS